MSDAGLRLAVAQPAAREGEGHKVEEACGFVRAAAERGARLVLFPECYPGPIRASSEYDALPSIAAVAGECECAVCWSRLERCGDGWLTVAYIHDAAGAQALRYERAHPATGDVHPILSGVEMQPGPSLGRATVAGVAVGVLICSELWLPEVARVHAVRGAEVLLAPAGGGFNRVAENWRLIARARAVENLCYVALTQQLFDDERGSALIAGPEAVLTDSEDPGLIVADLDLARSRWLRSEDDSMVEPKPFSSLPGLLRARRPELYAELAAPAEGLYEYGRPPRGSRGVDLGRENG